MFLLLHLLIFYNLIIWKPCVSVYIKDTSLRIKGKLNMLCKELLIDATSKVKSIQHLRRSVYKSMQFQYGSIFYDIRYRFRKMIKLYREVLRDMETSPELDGNAEVPDDKSYLNQLAEMDSLAHEILNFASMIQLHDANRHADKSKAGYDLFFRRTNEAPVWLELLDSLDNKDNNDPPEPPPEENNLTHTDKRRNGVWHYLVPIE